MGTTSRRVGAMLIMLMTQLVSAAKKTKSSNPYINMRWSILKSKIKTDQIPQTGLNQVLQALNTRHSSKNGCADLHAMVEGRIERRRRVLERLLTASSSCAHERSEP